MINTCKRERSVARNAGAAVARGRYLHFLDDDDWLAPDALQHVWALAGKDDADWLFGVTQLVNRQEQPLIRLRCELGRNSFVHAVAGEWVPLQASFIKARTFWDVGGFNPLISGPEDIDLWRRIALVGEVAGIDQLVAYVVMGETGSTTDYGRHPSLGRWARERTLEAPGVFSRMLDSATSSYWHGRILRAYLTSMIWNLQRRRMLTAASRLLYGLASLPPAGLGLGSTHFWQAAIKPHTGRAFTSGFKEVC
jgi:glycosyltransferase involved in cell wall biosynthesis